jgi:hypothetical protein
LTTLPQRTRIAPDFNEEADDPDQLGTPGGAGRLAFVVLYVLAFALGIEVGDGDREIRDYYADSGNRDKEVVAFFLIAGAALSLAVFATAPRSIIARIEQESAMLAALAWAGGIACAALILAGNAVSRATAFAASDEGFQLNVDTRDLFEAAGFLLFVSGALARFSSSSACHSRRCVTASYRAGSAGRASWWRHF